MTSKGGNPADAAGTAPAFTAATAKAGYPTGGAQPLVAPAPAATSKEEHLLNLLPETSVECLSYLPVAALGRTACTASQLKSLAYHDDVWQRKAGRLLSTVPAAAGCTLREYVRDATWRSGDGDAQPQAIQMSPANRTSYESTSGVAVQGDGVVLDSFTVEFMLRQQGYNSHNPVCMHTNSDWSRGWALYFQRDPRTLKFFVGDGFVAGREITMPVSQVPNGPAQPWVHICASFDGSTMRLYRDGDLKAHGAAGGGLVQPALINDDVTTQLILGGGFYHTWRYAFCGQIAEFRLWRGARSCEEIRASAFCFVGRTEPSLMCYFRFCTNMPRSRTVEDLSPAGNHGQMLACEYVPIATSEADEQAAPDEVMQEDDFLRRFLGAHQNRMPRGLSQGRNIENELLRFLMAADEDEDED